jgi:hypothetical protein
MTRGTLLAVSALVAVVSNLAWYQRKVTTVTAPLRPWREQAIMGLAIFLAGSAFSMRPGVIGYVSGGIAVLLAPLFVLLTFTSGLPQQRPGVVVGGFAPDFCASDADGKEFRLSNLRGSPVLLKFFRGHW